MRISKRVREEAIEDCLCRADHWIAYAFVTRAPIVTQLATAAYDAVPNPISGGFDVPWLEAAALLRGDDEHEPWSPGDAVCLLGGAP